MGSIFITNSNNTIDFNVTTMSFLYRSVVSAIPGRSHPSPQRLEMGTETCFALSIGGASPNPMIPQLFDLVSFSARGVASICHRIFLWSFMRPLVVSIGGASPSPSMQFFALSLAIRSVILGASHGRTVIVFLRIMVQLGSSTSQRYL